MSALTAPTVQTTDVVSTFGPNDFPQTVTKTDIQVSLTYTALPISDILAFTRSPFAGANVLFLGTTRNNFDNRPVSRLSYSAYPALALKSFLRIAEQVKEKHDLTKVCLVHRLGEVAVGEESIAVCVSAGHRGPAWRGAQEALELCKERVEIWKMEWFGGAETGQPEDGVWRANKDRDQEGCVLEPVKHHQSSSTGE